MKTYQRAMGGWTTPGGHPAVMEFRLETNDWNTITSAITQDEYGLGPLRLSGLAIDVGAHLGSVSVALALDNPELEVLAVEVIPDNLDLLRLNVQRNGLFDRVIPLHVAAAAPGIERTTVFYGGEGDESAEHHAFIGNSTLVYDEAAVTSREELEVLCVSLSWLLGARGRDAALLKIDCEGCEFGFLSDPAVARVGIIVGEWHPVNGRTASDIANLLSATHDVTFSGPVSGPGGFRAVRR